MTARDQVPEDLVHLVVDQGDASLPAACGADSGQSPLRTRRADKVTCPACLAIARLADEAGDE